MSFVVDHVCHIDNQLDRIQLPKQQAAASSASEPEEASISTQELEHAEYRTERVSRLQVAVKAISTVSSARSLVSTQAIIALLEGAGLVEGNPGPSHSIPLPENYETSTQEQELQWLLVSKATTQAYGLILATLLDRTIPLTSDIYYWNQIIGSARYTGLYTLQTSPLRVWDYASDVINESRSRIRRLTGKEDGDAEEKELGTTLSSRWRQFYGIVRESIRDRSLANVQSQILTPYTRCQMEAKSKMKHLKRIREMSASALGVLLDEGLMFDPRDEESVTSKPASNEEGDEWKTVVSKSITLMESVLQNVTTIELKPGEFEEAVFKAVDDENGLTEETANEGSSTPVALALRLQDILDHQLPSHLATSTSLVKKYGRPSTAIRYWPLGVVLFLSSGTLLRIFFQRKAEIRQWIQDFGETTRDFWFNWVVDPIKKVIGTIRHDKDSEIALMSKESLKGDRDSLERMVVDFATEKPSESTGKPMTQAEIADVRAKISAGDITPVLRAYEKDLKRPFIGTVRGDLIRTLLIQVQKTKVDVEVAIGGIDNLLKSQELVFGFVGLTPGLLVAIAVGRWLGGAVTGSKGDSSRRRHGGLIRPLRNIDRILSASTPVNNGMLSYKEHGLLLCEVHLLRQRAQSIFPSEIGNEFLEDLNELIDLRTGIDRQIRVVERIRWAYAKWIW